jgi:hypothetical protein
MASKQKIYQCFKDRLAQEEIKTQDDWLPFIL